MKISQRNLDKKFMQLAFNKAFEHLGSTKKNPSVGCVVVKNNTVISSGKTSLNGRPHAETNALNKKKKFLWFNNLYYLRTLCTSRFNPTLY